jgi:hypothetical protein
VQDFFRVGAPRQYCAPTEDIDLRWGMHVLRQGTSVAALDRARRFTSATGKVRLLSTSRYRRSARVAVVLLATTGLTFGVATSAYAASGSASGTGVSASASWTWDGCCSIRNISQSVSDTAGDDNDVYTNIRVYTGSNPNGDDVAGLGNSSGVGTTVTRSGRYWEASSNINGVRVRACVNDAGSDTCYGGSYIDNPNT